MSEENKMYAVINTTTCKTLFIDADVAAAKDKLQHLVERTAAVYKCKYLDYVDYPNNRAYTYKVMHNFDINKMYGTVVAIEHCEAYDKNLGLSIKIKPSNKIIETTRFCIKRMCKF